MSIFGGLDTPKWMEPIGSDERLSTQFAENVGRNFSDSMMQQRKVQMQQNLLKQQAAKLSSIAPKLAGADTPEKAWEVVSKNPQWLVDPQTAPAVSNYLKTQTQVAAAEKNSISGQIAIKDSTDFLNRVKTIDPTARAAIQGMTKNKDGSFSPMQWQALSLAEQTAQVQKENTATEAETAAMARGDLPTTTIGPKGVSTVYKPAPAAINPNIQPNEKVLDDGTKLIWMPGGKTLHVVKGDQAKEMTPTQLQGIAKTLESKDPNDKNAADIHSFLTDKAVKQVAPKKAPIPAPTNAPAKKPSASFKSADEVKQAFKSGALTKDEAMKILKDQFKFQ